jgi:CubicO group peptidase (beta-lactamase class C family)
VYIEKMKIIAATFPPGYTPYYSNINFALLSIALSKFVKSPSTMIFDETLKTPLGLDSTTFGNPMATTNDSVIPSGDETATGWANQLGPLNG